MTLGRTAFLIVSLSVTGSASANEWTTVSESSTVTFAAEQQGVPFEGRFNSFTASVSFDPDDPEKGSILGVVETGSVETGDAMTDETLLNGQWFDPETYPQSRVSNPKVSSSWATARTGLQLSSRFAT